MVLSEPSRAMAYTPRKTVYGLAREELHLKMQSFEGPMMFPYLDQ